MAEDPPHEELTPFIEACIPEPRVVNVYLEGLDQVHQAQVFVAGTTGRRAYMVSESREPTRISHNGVFWGYVYYGYTLGNTGEYATPVYSFPQDASTRIDVAIKRLEKRVFEFFLARGGRENPYREIHRMQTGSLVDGGYVLPLIDALEDDRYLYIITPFCDRGDLNNFIPRGPQNNLSVVEYQAFRIYKQMLDAIDHIHINPHVHGQFGIGHRDIKGGNFFVHRDRVLLADFAMSYPIPSGGMVKDMGIFGTLGYLPPEVFRAREFSAQGCDLWACTVTLFNLVTGLPLYEKPDNGDIFFVFNIMARGLSNEPHAEVIEVLLEEVDDTWKGRLHQTLGRIQRLSWQLRELLSGVLTLHPSQRWNIRDVRSSAWMQLAESYSGQLVQ